MLNILSKTFMTATRTAPTSSEAKSHNPQAERFNNRINAEVEYQLFRRQF